MDKVNIFGLPSLSQRSVAPPVQTSSSLKRSLLQNNAEEPQTKRSDIVTFDQVFGSEQKGGKKIAPRNVGVVMEATKSPKITENVPIAVGGTSMPKKNKPLIDSTSEGNNDAEYEHDYGDVVEYIDEILEVERLKIPKFKVSNYLETTQKGISKFMRGRAIDWIMEKTTSFLLHREHLYRAIKIFDLYLDRAKFAVKRCDLRMYAGVSLMLASKYEERFTRLSIDEVMDLCLYRYEREQILATEQDIFQALDYSFGTPLSCTFLRNFAKAVSCDQVTLTFAHYILETSLLFYEFVNVKEDIIAAGALFLALRTRKCKWDPRNSKFSFCFLQKVRPIMWQLNHMLHLRSKIYPMCPGVHTKYCDSKLFRVADLPLLDDQFAASRGFDFDAAALNL